MLGIVTWLVKQIAEKLPSRYGSAIITFYSSFEENCREIVNHSLPARRKPLKKNERKMPPENCPRRAPAPRDLPPRNKATPQEI